jgi:universal stress protein E
MNPIQKILIIVDPTAQQHPSVDKGASLAEKLGATLELYVCETKASKEARLATHLTRSSDQAPHVSVKAKLEELALPLRERGIDVTTETECADPLHVALVARTKRTTADLVIKDTHHHSLAKRTCITNTDWHLIRTCPVPLLLTKPTTWSPKPRVFAAVDPGHANDKPAALDYLILDCASLLSKKLGGELHVLHAYLPMAIVAAGMGNPPMAIAVSAQELEFEQHRSRERILELVSEYKVAAANIHLAVGAPSEVLPRLAMEMHADVVTMGALSRSSLERAFIGSTAEDVLERLPCDALIAKPPDFAALLPF